MRPIASDQQPQGGIFLALGSNLGDRRAHLQAALVGLEERGVRLLRCSRVYRTAPVGGPPQEEFLNMVVEADSDLSPGELLEVGHALERARGRRRDGEVRWGPRTLDIDLLLFRDRVVADPTLQLPHPRPDRDHSYMMFPMVVRPEAPFDREELTLFLEERNIETRPMVSLLNQPLYQRLFGAGMEEEYPVAGTVVIPGAPFRMSETPWSLRAPAPLLGQHNDEVYTQVLGYSAQDLAGWQAEGVV